MSFLGFFIQYKWVLLFYAVIATAVYLNRSRFDVEAKFIYLYRTKVGLKLIERLSRFRRTIKLISKIGIGFGFVGMVWITGFIALKSYKMIIEPKTLGVTPVLPGLPIAGTGIEFPLIMGWIALFIIIIIHESSHGIVARAFKVPIMSSGIAFFGPILAAFVEPDEKKLAKKSGTVQNAVMAAGPFSNIVTSIIFFLIFAFVLTPIAMALSASSGMLVSPINSTPAEEAGLPNDTIIISINNVTIDDEGFSTFFSQLKPNERVILKTDKGNSFELNTTTHPENSSKGYIGISLKKVIEKPKSEGIMSKALFYSMRWIKELFFWLYFISLNLGLINLFPIFITDGAKMLQVALTKLIREKQSAIAIWKLINQACIFMLLLLMFLPWIRSLIGLF